MAEMMREHGRYIVKPQTILQYICRLHYTTALMAQYIIATAYPFILVYNSLFFFDDVTSYKDEFPLKISPFGG